MECYLLQRKIKFSVCLSFDREKRLDKPNTSSTACSLPTNPAPRLLTYIPRHRLPFTGHWSLGRYLFPLLQEQLWPSLSPISMRSDLLTRTFSSPDCAFFTYLPGELGLKEHDLPFARTWRTLPTGAGPLWVRWLTQCCGHLSYQTHYGPALPGSNLVKLEPALYF